MSPFEFTRLKNQVSGRVNSRLYISASWVPKSGPGVPKHFKSLCGTSMIADALPEREQPWDVCIVGSGPVGMAVALELDSLGRDVLVLESGGRVVEPERSEDARARIADERTHVPMEIATCRALGGTSWTWGGRSVPLDDIDFEPRAWVPHSGWPIAHDDLKQWYGGACQYLLCGNGPFDLPPGQVPTAPADFHFEFLERWATETRVALIHGARIGSSPRIHVALNSTAVDLELDANLSQVESIVVATPAGRKRVCARRIVLAMGGVETTRLLLAVQRRLPSLFGGRGGPLGRFYMGHISGKIADIVFAQPGAIADFDFFRDATGCFVRRRFTLSAAAQRKHQLLNTAFFPDNPSFYDPTHRNGVLSAVFLALVFPLTGRKILPEGIRLAHIGKPPRHYAAHLRNVILGAPTGAKDIVDILRYRLLGKPRKPGFLLRNRAGRYALHYHAEQEPNPESRITLTEETDRFGVPRAFIDFRYTEHDLGSVVNSHGLLDQELRTAGLGRLEYRYLDQDLIERVRLQAADGYHQNGATRMGADPRSSVVDSNLKVHGVENLHIASSSVFPTSGQANSTFPAVALGLRLAHRLSACGASPITERGVPEGLRPR